MYPYLNYITYCTIAIFFFTFIYIFDLKCMFYINKIICCVIKKKIIIKFFYNKYNFYYYLTI